MQLDSTGCSRSIQRALFSPTLEIIVRTWKPQLNPVVAQFFCKSSDARRHIFWNQYQNYVKRMLWYRTTSAALFLLNKTCFLFNDIILPDSPLFLSWTVPSDILDLYWNIWSGSSDDWKNIESLPLIYRSLVHLRQKKPFQSHSAAFVTGRSLFEWIN